MEEEEKPEEGRLQNLPFLRERVAELETTKRQHIRIEKELRGREKESRQQAERLALALESIGDGVAFADIHGETQFVNRAFEKLFGYSAHEVLGKHVSIFSPADPDNRTQARAAFTEAFDRGRWSGEVRRVRKSGELFDAHLTLTPVKDQDGGVVGLIGITQDITQRKLAEERLKASEERSRLALDAAQMGTWEWDVKTDTYIVSERNVRLLGLTPGSYDGTNEAFLKIVHPEDRRLVKQAKTTAIEQMTLYDISYRIIWPDGSIRWIAATGQIYADEAGNAVRMIGINRDITERKNAEETEQELRAIGEVARIVTSNLDIDETYEHFAREIHNLIPFDKMSIVLVDETKGTWRVEHTFGDPGPFVKGKSLPLEGSVMEYLIKHGKGIIFNDTARDSQFWATKSYTENGFLSCLQVPLMSRDKVFGGVALLHRQHSMYGFREMHLLESLASHISPAIENSQLFQEVKRGQGSMEQKIRELTALNNQFQVYLEQRDETEDAYNCLASDILKMSEEARSLVDKASKRAAAMQLLPVEEEGDR